MRIRVSVPPTETSASSDSMFQPSPSSMSKSDDRILAGAPIGTSGVSREGAGVSAGTAASAAGDDAGFAAGARFPPCNQAQSDLSTAVPLSARPARRPGGAGNAASASSETPMRDAARRE